MTNPPVDLKDLLYLFLEELKTCTDDKRWNELTADIEMLRAFLNIHEVVENND